MARRSKPKLQMPRSQPGPVAVEVQTPPARRAATIISLIVGLCIFLSLGNGRGLGWQRGIAVAVVTLVALVPAVSRLFHKSLDRLRNPSPSFAQYSPLLVFLIATAYLIVTAFLQGRDLFPKTHDECSYELGMRMLAHGRLWMPPHPMGDFFESFYILNQPVYASIYFPGTALMFVPGIWLNLPSWLLPAITGSAAVTFLFLVVAKLLNPASAWLSVLLILSCTWFRTIAMMLMSQTPMLLLGLAVLGAWLKWRDNRRWYWLLLVGITSGWGAITRPIDALAYAIPVGLGILLDLRGSPFPNWLKSALLIIAGAAPFLLLQAVFDVRVTGHVFQTPYTLYLQREQPGATFGFHHFDPSARGQSTLPQMRKDLQYSQTYFALHQPDNFWKPWLFTQHPGGFVDRPAYLAMIADSTLPARFLIILLPIGLLALNTLPRRIVLLIAPLFVFLYVLNPFFLEHYAIVLIPAVILCLLLSAEAVANAFPKYRKPLSSALTALIVASAFTALWEVNHVLVTDPQLQVSDEPLPSPLLQKSHELHGQRAVILYKWDPTRNWKEEPVCNSDVAWPDEAEVVRAHDLGPRDGEIIDYYGRMQPERMFFLWDEKSDTLGKLGTAGDLRQALLSGQKLEALIHPGK